MNHNSPLWNASLADRAAVLPRAVQRANEYHDMERRAVGIVAARPYLMECRNDGETFYHLNVSETVTTLTWTYCGALSGGLLVQRCTFPTRLLDMSYAELHAWQHSPEARAIERKMAAE